MSPAHESFLVAQAGTALGAAASQDLAAVGGSHSLAEAMDLLAVELLGLIGTFRCHVETPPVRIPAARKRRHLLDTALSDGAVNKSASANTAQRILYRLFENMSMKT